MQNRLLRIRGTTRHFVTCALGIEATENPKLSLLYVLILWKYHVESITITGLMIGALVTIRKLVVDLCKTFGLHKDLLIDISI